MITHNIVYSYKPSTQKLWTSWTSLNQIWYSYNLVEYSKLKFKKFLKNQKKVLYLEKIRQLGQNLFLYSLTWSKLSLILKYFNSTFLKKFDLHGDDSSLIFFVITCSPNSDSSLKFYFAQFIWNRNLVPFFKKFLWSISFCLLLNHFIL